MRLGPRRSDVIEGPMGDTNVDELENMIRDLQIIQAMRD